jgi:hypothetical protein
MCSFMIKKCFRIFTLFLGLWAFSALSCTDFFSNSLAPWAQRDRTKLTVKVTADTVDQLLADYGNDPDTSLAILKGIKDAVKGASGHDKLDLQSAALEAAANAAGLGNTVLNQFNTILDAVADPDPTVIESTIQNIIDSLDNLQGASAALLGALPDPAVDPTGFDNFVANSSPDKLALAAAVLLAAEAENNGGAGSYISGFNPASPATPNEEMAAAIATKIAGDYASPDSEVDKVIQNMLAQLNLITI